MLARLARELPCDGYLYEPKWDGFRCLAFKSGTDITLYSRHQRPLARYFPELVEAFAALPVERFAVDGEIVIIRPDRFDFEALLTRLHPAASRVARLRRETPASFVAFDVLVRDDRDLTARPFQERRLELERLLGAAPPPLYVTPITEDVAIAREWLRAFRGRGIDGVVAKPRDLPYRPGERAMVKIKHEQTADCVVAGFRVYAGEPVVASLLLGLYDDAGALRHVGVVASFNETQRRVLFGELGRLAIPLEEHPWQEGFLIPPGPVGRLPGAAGRWTPTSAPDWIPIRPERVCEVAYDSIEAGRFRHAARFRRWRPDRDARTCTFAQLSAPLAHPVEVLR
jgi:ATP-dependent DNA ligase